LHARILEEQEKEEYTLLEVWGATAPLLLAPAEEWRGPLGPAESLWLPRK